jgi:D-glycero-alpha-D-manno-heptose-7-phosphate kinase
MIISRTPLRVSFAGGGSDFPSFYREHGGAVLCSAIDKYIHVILQDRFDDRIRVGYSTTELCDRIDDVRHELVRESMRLVGLDRGLEISTMADVPSTGTGLGSSSSVTVGLLGALYAHLGRPQTRETMAQEAVRIEVDILKKPIGKQDQYIAACGGLNKIVFNPDDTVRVKAIPLSPSRLREFGESFLLFYTGRGRDSGAVLLEQKERVKANSSTLRELVKMADIMESMVLRGDLADFGRALDHCWGLKKALASNVTNPSIDETYARARRAGAIGGKITGAGGGGFLLLCCEPSCRQSVRQALRDLREMPFGLEPDGTRVVFSR